MVNTRSSQSGKKKKKNERPKSKPALFKSSPREWKLLIEEKDYCKARISIYSSYQVIDNIKKKLTPRQKELFAQTCFGQFLQLCSITFWPQLVHHILLRQLVCPRGENSMWFRIGGKEYEFGLKEFALITGLDCGEFGSLEVEDKLRNRICDGYFDGHDIVTGKVLDLAFKKFNGDNDEDVVKLAQLYLLERFLLGKDCRRPTEKFSIGLVDNAEDFNKFRWGSFLYKVLIESIKSLLKYRDKKIQKRPTNDSNIGSFSYELHGFPYVLQFWACECIPLVGKKFACRIDTKRTQMLNWVINNRPGFKMLENEVFNAHELQVKSGTQLTQDKMNEEPLCNSSKRKRLKKNNETASMEGDISFVEKAQEKTTKGKNNEESEDNGKIHMNEDENDKGKHYKNKSIDTTMRDTHIKVGKDLNSEFPASVREDFLGSVRKELLASLREEFLASLKEELLASMREEFLASVKEELLASMREEAKKTVTEEICRANSATLRKELLASLREEFLASVKEELLASLREEAKKIDREEICRANSATTAEMSVKITGSKQQTNVADADMMCILSEAGDKDDNGDKCTVQRKRRRDNPTSEIDISCFTVDLFEPPPPDEKEEFDKWIKIGLKRNRKNKYSDALNKIDPVFDFTVGTCKKKDWFFSLNESGQWLNSSHIDVALYFLRKKKKDHPDVFRYRCTTTDWLFPVVLTARYPQFKKDPEKFLWDKQAFIQDTLKGIEPRHSLPWIDVDIIYIPLNIDMKHWVLLVLDLKKQTIYIHDSYRAAKHDKQIMLACCEIAEMVPWILRSVGFFDARKDLEDTTSPLDVKHVDGIPQQDNGGDCGIFMLKFIEFLMQNTPLETCTQEKMSFFRNKMAVELYAYGKKKMMVKK